MTTTLLRLPTAPDRPAAGGTRQASALERVPAVGRVVVLADEVGEVAHRADGLVEEAHLREDRRLAVVAQEILGRRVVPRLDADAVRHALRADPRRQAREDVGGALLRGAALGDVDDRLARHVRSLAR